ncbi:MAG TPA: phosphate/phosphite/phosphonate ABC transporter substrate-binding protein [Chromatiales bacterium]|nr:phosphate/phosphite/phosphonate ABC transporter substrate-binding protein [Chromatiales bacterium]
MSFLRCCMWGLIFLLPASELAAPSPYVFGIFPYVTTSQLIRFHKPLADYFETSLQHPVTLVTAPDFHTFVNRTRKGQYDFIMTAPHLGLLAEKQGYRRVAMSQHTVQGIYITRRDSGIRALDDLRGKVITMAAREAIIFQTAEQQMRQHGLVDGENITIRVARTHNNAMFAPLRGEADVAVTGILLWRKLGHANRDRMREIGRTPPAPGFLLMAHSRVPEEVVKRLRQALLDFAHTPQGEAYFHVTGLRGFQPISDATMQWLAPYIRIYTRQ